MTRPAERRTRKQRSQIPLSSKLEKNLVAYAVAATAAGVGLLAGPPAADAKIVYTPANVVISGKPLPIDLNHDGIVDFFLFHYGFHTTTGGNALVACLDPAKGSMSTYCAASSRGTNARNAFKMVDEWGAAVHPGGKIIGGDKFRSMHSADLGSVVFRTSSHFKPAWRGPWMNGGKGVKNRYLGVKFQIKGRFHYGWARITVTTTSNSFTATLTGYAYETIPGKGIIAGKIKGPKEIETQSPSAALSEPVRPFASLGTLALGSPGLAIWRREESIAAAE
jgi:hypothetical protein